MGRTVHRHRYAGARPGNPLYRVWQGRKVCQVRDSGIWRTDLSAQLCDDWEDRMCWLQGQVANADVSWIGWNGAP